MKKVKEVSTKYRVTKSDNDPVKCGDHITLTRKVKSRGPGPDIVEPPKPPRKSLDERIAEAIVKTVPSLISDAISKTVPSLISDAIAKTVPNLINQALKPVMSRLDKQDEFNKVVTDYMEDQKFLNKKFSDYIESHP